MSTFSGNERLAREALRLQKLMIRREQTVPFIANPASAPVNETPPSEPDIHPWRVSDYMGKPLELRFVIDQCLSDILAMAMRTSLLSSLPPTQSVAALVLHRLAGDRPHTSEEILQYMSLVAEALRDHIARSAQASLQNQRVMTSADSHDTTYTEPLGFWLAEMNPQETLRRLGQLESESKNDCGARLRFLLHQLVGLTFEEIAECWSGEAPRLSACDCETEFREMQERISAPVAKPKATPNESVDIVQTFPATWRFWPAFDSRVQKLIAERSIAWEVEVPFTGFLRTNDDEFTTSQAPDKLVGSIAVRPNSNTYMLHIASPESLQILDLVAVVPPRAFRRLRYAEISIGHGIQTQSVFQGQENLGLTDPTPSIALGISDAGTFESIPDFEVFFDPSANHLHISAAGNADGGVVLRAMIEVGDFAPIFVRLGRPDGKAPRFAGVLQLPATLPSGPIDIVVRDLGADDLPYLSPREAGLWLEEQPNIVVPLDHNADTYEFELLDSDRRFIEDYPDAVIALRIGSKTPSTALLK